VVDVETEANCAHVGVTGVVRDGDNDDDDPVPNVTIQVVGDKDGFRGPYRATTGSDGRFGLVIGEFGKVPADVEFSAQIYGSEARNKNRARWKVVDDCHGDKANQVLNLQWAKD
jgi:hypothetical protein